MDAHIEKFSKSWEWDYTLEDLRYILNVSSSRCRARILVGVTDWNVGHFIYKNELCVLNWKSEYVYLFIEIWAIIWETFEADVNLGVSAT